jgi:C_GCAxxG_C_C family probable redox protein
MSTERGEEALKRFQSGSNCAQSVLSVYLPAVGIPEPIAHKIGAGLGGGVGRKQYLCGALNAGAIVLSAKLGNESGDDTAGQEAASARVREFVNQFEATFKSSQCRDLLGIDISTPEGRQKAAESGVHRSVCDECLRHVCAMLDGEI